MSQPKPEFLDPIETVDEVYSVGRALGLPKPGVVETNWELQIVSTGLPVLIVPVRTLTAVRSINVRHTRSFVVTGVQTCALPN